MEIGIEREETSEEKKLLVFHLELKNFGIELNKIKEITDLLPTTRLPGALKFVKGLGNLRGEIIPIISLRERLNISGVERGNQLIIVIGKKINYGLLIDKIKGIYDVKTEISKSISSIFSKDVETSFLKGVSRVDGLDVLLIDCEKLIETDE
ncbi:MAG: purine-binding chemotaxis protein CheW [Candidatus Cloacimonadota bacterium]|nr:MAG: purine-binding chemotaxis protein CheW [Candidatus Cloacimonadota bacterium]